MLQYKLNTQHSEVIFAWLIRGSFKDDYTINAHRPKKTNVKAENSFSS